MSCRPLAVFTLVLALTFSGKVLLAQSSTGTLSGSVRDDSGAVLPGVAITLKSLETGLVRSLVTDDEGRYHAASMGLGKYEIQAELAGFQTGVRTGIELTVGREATVDFTLKVGEISEKMVVTGEAPLVETTNSTIAGLVSTEQLDTLPLNGRSFSELAQLQTGVSASNASGGGSGQGFGKKITISGARPYETNFTLDGQDINDSYNFVGSAAGIVAGVDAVREFKVITNPFSSEYGKMAGGTVQVVTKSGTNELHGSAYEYLRNDNLDARNFFDAGDVPEFKRNQFGGSFGGPIVKDKTFFFANFEGLREGLGISQRSSVPDANAQQGLFPGTGGVLQNIGVHPAVRPYLNLYPLPNGTVFPDGRGDFHWTDNQVTVEDFYLGRIDHNFGRFMGFGQSNSFQGRYSIDDAQKDTAQDFLIGRREQTRTQYLSLVMSTVVSAKVVNRLQGAYNRSRLEAFNPPGERLLASGRPEIMRLGNAVNGFSSISPGSGVSGIGGDTLSPREFILNLFQVKDDISFQVGRHSFNIGTNMEKFNNNWLHTFRAVGSFSFSNFPNFLRNIPTSFISVQPDSSFNRSFRQWLFAWYVQDDFRVSNNLTLNLGLRHEFITVPTEKWGRLYILKDLFNPNADPIKDPVQGFFKNPSLKAFAPRLGVAWDPTGSGKLAIRGGFGLFYSQLINNMWRFPAAQTAPLFKAAEIRSATTPVDFPNAFTTQRALLGGSIAIQGIVPEPNQPTTMQYSLNIQRELARDMVVTVEYSGSRGYDIARVSDWNQRVPVRLPDGRLFFGPEAQIYNQKAERYWINTYDSASWYNAFRISANRRFGGDFGFQTSYTYSKSIDYQSNQQGGTDFSNEGVGYRVAGPPFLIPADDSRGLSSYDVRQNFTTSFNYNLPFGTDKISMGSVGNAILGSWSVNGIVRLASGIPLSVSGSRTSNMRTFPRWGALDGGVPDLVAGRDPYAVRPQNPDQYFDPTAYSLPEPGFFGNLGRHVGIGPGTAVVDFSLFKGFSMGEKVSGQFRAEFFNVLNRPNFSLPSGTLFNADTFAYNATVGRISSSTSTSRQIQFALRLVF